MEEIKCCPFCGHKAILDKKVSLRSGNSTTTPYHDIEVEWSIECRNCGTEKKAFGRSYYSVNNDGEFELVPQYFSDTEKAKPSDKRLEVIEMWNERHN